MNNLITLDNRIHNNNGKITTTSFDVADVFEKRHCDVLRSIKRLKCSYEFNVRNFALVKYLDEKGETRISYKMTKDGFVFLVMGFTGDKAAQFKEAYIDAFNKMEAAIIDKNGLVPVKPHTRRLPSAPREIKLSEKARSEIGGIVKKCVAVAVKETLGAILSPKEPLIAELKPNEKLTKAERKFAEAVVEFGFEKERIGKIKGMLEGAMNAELVEIMKQAEPI